MYLNEMIVESKSDQSTFLSKVYLYDIFYVVSLFNMANLGFYQVKSMFELSLRLTETNQAKTLEKNIKILNIVTLVIVLLNTACMIVLAIYFALVLYRLYTYCYFDTAGNQICTTSFKGL